MRCAIFDVDGTLVDSNDAHARAWVDAFREHGRTVEYRLVRRCIGMGGDKLMPTVSGLEEDSPEGAPISARRKEIFRERYLPGLKGFPSVPELLARLRDDGVRLVVASSARKEELGHLLQIARAADFFADTTSSDDAEESKPDPDIVRAALQKGACGAADALMVGDTPYDVEAARAAGIGAIVVRSGGWDLPELSGALAVFDDVAEMLRRYDEWSGRQTG